MERNKNFDEIIVPFKQVGACPITFVGKSGQALPTPELNDMFTLGYRMKKSADTVRSDEFVDIVTNNGGIENSMVGTFINDAANADSNAACKAVISYLVTNITDLTINLIYTKMPECFILPDGMSFASFESVDVNEIRNIVESNVRYAFPHFPVHYENGADNSIASDFELNVSFFKYNQLMDTILSIMITQVFDKIIVNSVNKIFELNMHEAFYKACYAECYECAADDVKCVPANDGFIYSFVTGIVREKFSEIIPTYRQALLLVATSVSYMGADVRNEAINTGAEAYHNYLSTKYGPATYYDDYEEATEEGTGRRKRK